MDEEQDNSDAINHQMELLPNVRTDFKGYQCIFSGLEKDDDLTAHQKLMVYIQSQLVFVHFILQGK
jgi:hypothetical protein